MLRRRRLLPVLLASLALVVPVSMAPPANASPGSETVAAKPVSRPGSYRNPLDVEYQGARAASCADPDVVRDPKSSDWFLYCTSDALNSTPGPDGDLVIHILPTYRSHDLVHWTYQGDALASHPSWITSNNLWAPDVVRHGGRWFLYFATPDAGVDGGGAAIGVLTANSPAGPWTDSGAPVVAPSDQAGHPGTRRSNIDPEVVDTGSARYLFFGSFGGGLFARKLSADGLHTSSSTERQIAITDRYEGSFVMKHDGWYYLLASATNCCNGPLTGYTVFAARSRNPLGPYRDKTGRSVLAGRVGGSVVLTQNGNRWVGPGHNTGFTDFSGQDWLIYHAVDRNDPYYAGNVGYTKRPALMDPLDWRGGWPTVRGGAGPSDSLMPAPAAQPGQRTAYRPHFVRYPEPGREIRAASDTFAGTRLSPAWTWVRKPAADTFTVKNGQLRWQTQDADLHPPATPLASVLTRSAPRGDYVVQTKINVSVPPTGDGYNYVQGGLLIYGGDGHYVKLSVSSIGATRQTEFGIEKYPQPTDYPNYGNAVVGPLGHWTWLRITVQHERNGVHYTASTSPDGRHWDHGATWVTDLGARPRIGLISMGGSGFTTTFASVITSTVRR